jgi:hypothetical protein
MKSKSGGGHLVNRISELGFGYDDAECWLTWSKPDQQDCIVGYVVEVADQNFSLVQHLSPESDQVFGYYDEDADEYYFDDDPDDSCVACTIRAEGASPNQGRYARVFACTARGEWGPASNWLEIDSGTNVEGARETVSQINPATNSPIDIRSRSNANGWWTIEWQDPIGSAIGFVVEVAEVGGRVCFATTAMSSGPGTSSCEIWESATWDVNMKVRVSAIFAEGTRSAPSAWTGLIKGTVPSNRDEDDTLKRRQIALELPMDQ